MEPLPKPPDHTACGLWHYRPISGLWALRRTCEPGQEVNWLKVYQQTEPGEYFRLGTRKPRGRPTTPMMIVRF